MLLFMERVDLAEKVDKWIEENKAKKCTLSVITYLCGEEMIKEKRMSNQEVRELRLEIKYSNMPEETKKKLTELVEQEEEKEER